MTPSPDGKRMILIGLLGKIGAGKSTVARRFAEHGAVVIDADALAHEVLGEPAVVAAIAARFGAGVLAPDGSVLRPVLAEVVFGPTAEHAAALGALEAIVHPRVHERIGERLAGLQAAATVPVTVVLDVPLLGKGGWADRCDWIVTLKCPDSVREQRLAQRRLSPRQRAAREAAWQAAVPPHLPAEKTLCVDTSGDVAYTWAQVDRIWSIFHPSAPLP